jgi:hypothetical protein
VRYAGAYHCFRSSSSSHGLVSVTTSLRRYGTAEGSISHLSRHDIARQLGLQMRAVRRAPELLEGLRGRLSEYSAGVPGALRRSVRSNGTARSFGLRTG